jgi:hypothetical protein
MDDSPAHESEKTWMFCGLITINESELSYPQTHLASLKKTCPTNALAE